MRSVDTNHVDNVYFNVEIKSNNSKRLTIAEYDATRTRNIVDKANDYYLAVLRFTIPSFSVPLLVFEPQENDPTLGVYSVTLEYEGDVSRAYVPYLSTNSLPDTNAEYYYQYSIQSVVLMINQAFENAFVGLNSPPVGSVAPYLSFSPETNLFTLWGNADDYDISNAISNKILIYFNEYLWTLLYGFPKNRLNTSNSLDTNDGRDVRIEMKYYGNNYSAPNNPNDPITNYITVTQDNSSLYNWNPYKKIVLKTSLLPIQSEYSRGSGDVNEKILTDFTPFNTLDDLRSTYQYVPSGQYRLIDFLSTGPITNIDVDIYWQDSNDRLIPLQLPWNSQANIKLGFLKKSLYHNYWMDPVEKDTRPGEDPFYKNKNRMSSRMLM